MWETRKPEVETISNDKAPPKVCKSSSPLWGRQAGMQGHTTLAGFGKSQFKKKDPRTHTQNCGNICPRTSHPGFASDDLRFVSFVCATVTTAQLSHLSINPDWINTNEDSGLQPNAEPFNSNKQPF